MPELPEVETIVRQLNRLISSKKITEIDVLNDKSFEGDYRSIINFRVNSIKRKAKTLIFYLEHDKILLIHLKMTGQLIYQEKEKRTSGGHPTKDFYDELPNKHTRVIIDFDDNSKLFFNDLRKFGWIKLTDEDGLKEYFSKYGPDAVPIIDVTYLKARAKKMPRSSIKKFILDQNVISGVGNIYADESLFEAKIHPESLVSSLSDEQWVELAKDITEKLTFAIEKGGTTDSDYVNVYGEKGGMQDYLKVYHKDGSRCPRECGGMIEKTKVGGRGTHFCPNCQKVQR